MKRCITLLFLISVFFSSMMGAEKNFSILVVDDEDQYNEDNSSISTVTSTMYDAITAAGYTYSTYDIDGFTVDGSDDPALTIDTLNKYDLVIWYCGRDASGLELWDNNDSDNEIIKSYLDNGGTMWVIGQDFLYDRYVSPTDNFSSGSFPYDYLGISQYSAQNNINLLNISDRWLYAVNDNGVSSIDLQFTYVSYSHYVDGVIPVVSGAKSVFECDFSGTTYSTAVMYETADFSVFSLFANYNLILETTAKDTLTKHVIDYMFNFSYVAVDSVKITPAGPQTIITDEGTLQLSAMAYPDTAYYLGVDWSLIDNGVAATLSDEGLLTASGTVAGNGIVQVLATSQDTSVMKADTITVIISNQDIPTRLDLANTAFNFNVTAYAKGVSILVESSALGQLDIIDMSGKTMRTHAINASSSVLSTAGLSPGIYFCVFSSHEGKSVKKIIL